MLLLFLLFSLRPHTGAGKAGSPVLPKDLTGDASWYRGFIIAGDKFFIDGYYAAMWGVPLGTRVRVMDLENGRSIVVIVNDRGPNKRFVEKGRIIDLAAKAFRDLNGDFKASTIRVKLEILQ